MANKLMKMNLKEWKKITTSKNHTVLRNKAGHELKIVHKSLSKDNQEALDSLPHYDDGGTVQPASSSPPEPDPQAAKQVQDGATQSGWQPETWKKNLKSGLGLAKGGEVKSEYEDEQASNVGKPPEPQFNEPAQPNFDPKPNFDGDPSKNSASNTYAKGGMIRHYDEGTPPGSGGVQPVAQPTASVSPQGIDQASQDLQSMGQPGVQAPQPAAAPGEGDAQPITQAQADQVKPSPYDAQALGEQKANSALAVGNDEAAGSMAQAKALQAGQDALHPEKQQAIYDALQKTEQDSQKEFQGRYEEYKKALANPVDPNRYLNNLRADTGRSILNIIGLALGGVGQAFGAGPNPALAMMNASIDRDIQAQKNVLGNKETLYSTALDKYKNDRMATTEARHQLMYNAVQQMQEAALKSGSPLAKDRAQGFAADAYNQELPSVQQQNMYKVLNQVTSEGGDASQVLPYLRVANPSAAKSIEEHTIPNVKGMTSVPVPDAARDEITSKQNLIDGAARLKQFIDQNSVSGKLDPSKRGYLSARATELEQTYRKAVQASTSEGEKKSLENIIGDNPSAVFASETYSPRLQGMIDATKEQLGGKYNQFGVKPESIPAQYRSGEQAAPQPAALSPGAQNMIKFAQNVLKTSQNPKDIASAQRVLKMHNIQ